MIAKPPIIIIIWKSFFEKRETLSRVFMFFT